MHDDKIPLFLKSKTFLIPNRNSHHCRSVVLCFERACLKLITTKSCNSHATSPGFKFAIICHTSEVSAGTTNIPGAGSWTESARNYATRTRMRHFLEPGVRGHISYRGLPSSFDLACARPGASACTPPTLFIYSAQGTCMPYKPSKKRCKTEPTYFDDMQYADDLVPMYVIQGFYNIQSSSSDLFRKIHYQRLGCRKSSERHPCFENNNK